MASVDLIQAVRQYHPQADLTAVQRAYALSVHVRVEDSGTSDEPRIIVHPVEIAHMLMEMKLDVASIVGSLLYRLVENSRLSLTEVEATFDQEIALLVNRLMMVRRFHFKPGDRQQAENFRRLLIVVARDLRVLLIQLADRVCTMRSFGSVHRQKQREMAQEVLEIYAPLAHRFGLDQLKSELEDRALRQVYPHIYNRLKSEVGKRRAEREAYIAEVVSVFKRRLEEAGIEADISGRPKHFYSIYEKMQRNGLRFNQLFDLVGIRIVVGSVRDCYHALTVLHNHWETVRGRFKDYIARPKPSFYQSLHITLIGPSNQLLEVQIRTWDMHRIAEEGMAAHWLYKDPEGLVPEDAGPFLWLRQLLGYAREDRHNFLQSPGELEGIFDEVYVFSPKGDLFNFPQGSTVIDFAYRIHTEIGNRCIGARVNGQSVPVTYILQSADTVEIVTSSEERLSKDWLNWVKTRRARSRIRRRLRA